MIRGLSRAQVCQSTRKFLCLSYADAHTHKCAYMRGPQLAHVPLVVVVSDFEGRGAHSWIENKAQYAVCGTSICRQQALDFGLPTSHVYQTSGMILRPSFYEPDQDASRSAADRKVMIGLDPDRRTVLVFWGGVGSSKVLDIGLRIRDGAREKLNVIFLCGRNAALMEQLNRVAWGDTRVCVQGFTQRVSFYMQLSDMIVCKPGPGVCSEAALLGVPIIVQYSVFTLPQEGGSVQVGVESRSGAWVRTAGTARCAGESYVGHAQQRRQRDAATVAATGGHCRKGPQWLRPEPRGQRGSV